MNETLLMDLFLNVSYKIVHVFIDIIFLKSTQCNISLKCSKFSISTYSLFLLTLVARPICRVFVNDERYSSDA